MNSTIKKRIDSLEKSLQSRRPVRIIPIVVMPDGQAIQIISNDQEKALLAQGGEWDLLIQVED